LIDNLKLRSGSMVYGSGSRKPKWSGSNVFRFGS